MFLLIQLRFRTGGHLRTPRRFELGDGPEVLSVRLKKIEPLGDFPTDLSLIFNARLNIHHPTELQQDPAISKVEKRRLILLQRNLFNISQPLHQQSTRRQKIPLIQKSLHDQSKSRWRIKPACMRGPEFDISVAAATFMPEFQTFRHMLRRLKRCQCVDSFHAGDFMGRELVPPLRELFEVLGDPENGLILTRRCRFIPEP